MSLGFHWDCFLLLLFFVLYLLFSVLTSQHYPPWYLSLAVLQLISPQFPECAHNTNMKNDERFCHTFHVHTQTHAKRVMCWTFPVFILNFRSTVLTGNEDACAIIHIFCFFFPICSCHFSTNVSRVSTRLAWCL